MMTPAEHATSAAESGVVLVAKTAPPVSVSIATVFGIPVSELVLWATLIYTTLLILHKLKQIYSDFWGKKS